MQIRNVSSAVFCGVLFAFCFGNSYALAGGKKEKPQLTWAKLKYATARAYTFNFGEYGPGSRGLHAYGPYRQGSERMIGMNPAIRNSADLTAKQAAAAWRLVKGVKGEVLVSKCAFPRHGVVFFDKKDNPIASVSICFECGDILVWPEWDQRPAASLNKYGRAFMKKYDRTMARWKTFFEALEDMPTDWKVASRPAPAKNKAPKQ